jgi:hypothetical protein
MYLSGQECSSMGFRFSDSPRAFIQILKDEKPCPQLHKSLDRSIEMIPSLASEARLSVCMVYIGLILSW